MLSNLELDLEQKNQSFCCWMVYATNQRNICCDFSQLSTIFNYNTINSFVIDRYFDFGDFDLFGDIAESSGSGSDSTDCESFSFELAVVPVPNVADETLLVIECFFIFFSNLILTVFENKKMLCSLRNVLKKKTYLCQHYQTIHWPLKKIIRNQPNQNQSIVF